MSSQCVVYLLLIFHQLTLAKYLTHTHCPPQDSVQPIMCSYKVVKVFFEVWGLQTRVEAGVHRVSEIL